MSCIYPFTLMFIFRCVWSKYILLIWTNKPPYSRALDAPLCMPSAKKKWSIRWKIICPAPVIKGSRSAGNITLASRHVRAALWVLLCHIAAGFDHQRHITQWVHFAAEWDCVMIVYFDSILFVCRNDRNCYCSIYSWYAIIYWHELMN
jgi:hypothetical protein